MFNRGNALLVEDHSFDREVEMGLFIEGNLHEVSELLTELDEIGTRFPLGFVHVVDLVLSLIFQIKASRRIQAVNDEEQRMHARLEDSFYHHLEPRGFLILAEEGEVHVQVLGLLGSLLEHLAQFVSVVLLGDFQRGLLVIIFLVHFEDEFQQLSQGKRLLDLSLVTQLHLPVLDLSDLLVVVLPFLVAYKPLLGASILLLPDSQQNGESRDSLMFVYFVVGKVFD